MQGTYDNIYIYILHMKSLVITTRVYVLCELEFTILKDAPENYTWHIANISTTVLLL